MHKLIFSIFLLLGFAASADPIVVHNRILTTIDGETISMMDVVKKMDFFLSEYYPQHLDSPPARYQFYTTQWRSSLQQLVDQKLMLADAESRKIQASDMEVREEIQNRWGPNVMQALDKLGLTYEEAKKLVHQELVVQKMQWLRVTSKVLPKVTTDIVNIAYKAHLQNSPPKEVWTYQFLTLRCETVEKALSIAQEIETLSETAEKELSVAADLFKQKFPESDWKSLTLSAQLESEDKELSNANRDALKNLSPDSWSAPVIQQSRDGSQVVRIFHLKDHTKQTAPPFERLANELKQKLLNQRADEEMNSYLTRLYQRFNYDPNQLDIPPNFEPFSFE